jgi:hypothetical protein
MISFGATTSSISLLIDNDDVLPAVKRLHREFFESREDSNLFEELRPASTLL